MSFAIKARRLLRVPTDVGVLCNMHPRRERQTQQSSLLLLLSPYVWDTVQQMHMSSLPSFFCSACHVEKLITIWVNDSWGSQARRAHMEPITLLRFIYLLEVAPFWSQAKKKKKRRKVSTVLIIKSRCEEIKRAKSEIKTQTVTGDRQKRSPLLLLLACYTMVSQHAAFHPARSEYAKWNQMSKKTHKGGHAWAMERRF